MADAEDRDPAFTVVRHGFDRNQVRRHLEQLAAAAERSDDARLESVGHAAELRGELEIARREIAALSERLDTLDHGDSDDSGDSATRLLAVAKSQATEVTARAKVAAEQTWAAAEQASAALRERYRRMLADLDEQHAELNASHTGLLAAAKAEVEKMTTEAARRRAAIDKEAERDRVRIDREFSESMTTKRAALQRELDTARAASVKEVDDRLRKADEEAKLRVDAVTEQVKRLNAVREKLTGRLRETKALLDRSESLLEPVSEETDVDVDERLPMPPKAGATAGADVKRAVPPQRDRQPAKR